MATAAAGTGPEGAGPILITGTAGFIGAALAERLLAAGVSVHGLDNLDPYYDVALKRARLERLQRWPGYRHHTLDIAEAEPLQALFAELQPAVVIHLAAQAGVRYSLEQPAAYTRSNVTGFLNVLEACRRHPIRHLLYASTSSVYGANRQLPFEESQPTEHPVSLYAATKKANELMAHSYAHLFGIPCTGLRFFTVYGPWMRPDMALLKFALKIWQGEPITLYNGGHHHRSFTYIDDIVDGLVALMEVIPTASADPALGRSQVGPHTIYNIGSEDQVALLDYVDLLEAGLGRRAIRQLAGQQPGDVLDTAASMAKLRAAVGFAPRVDVRTGVANFCAWFRVHVELLIR